MTTFQPRPPYSDTELSSLYPQQLHLQHVQILLRHGERTPVIVRFTNTGLPAYWPYCSTLRQLRSAVLNPGSGSGIDATTSSSPEPDGRFSTIEWKRRLETLGAGDSTVMATGPKGELDNICDTGMLTDRGRETTHALGTRLRRLYIDQLGFLPASIKDADFMYLRATPVPRALESMQQTFQGLYPPHTRAADFPSVTILSRSVADETLFPNVGSCLRFAELAKSFAKRAAGRWDDSDEMEYLNKKIGKWMPEESSRIAMGSHPRVIGILDSVNATRAHGPATKLPKEFYDPKVIQILDKLSVEEWYAGYQESREYRTLGIGSLLGDIVSRLVTSAEQQRATNDGHGIVPQPGQGHGKPTPVRFGLSGCHDTTLASVLSSLGAFDNIWPPFTSHIAIELFRSADKSPSSPTVAGLIQKPSTWWPSFLGGSGIGGASPSSIGRKQSEELSQREKQSLQGYYVRLRYNDKSVTIPGCRPQGKHLDGDESFCTLEAFKAIVDKFTPRDWREQCRTNSKAPAFPAKPEPAGF